MLRRNRRMTIGEKQRAAILMGGGYVQNSDTIVVVEDGKASHYDARTMRPLEHDEVMRRARWGNYGPRTAPVTVGIDMGSIDTHVISILNNKADMQVVYAKEVDKLVKQFDYEVFKDFLIGNHTR